MSPLLGKFNYLCGGLTNKLVSGLVGTLEDNQLAQAEDIHCKYQ